MCLSRKEFISDNTWESENMDAADGSRVYVLVAGSKCLVFPVKERCLAESRDQEQMLELKERESISGYMEKRISLCLIYRIIL